MSHVQNKHKTLLWRLSWFTSKLILLEYQLSSQCCFWWTWHFFTIFPGQMSMVFRQDYFKAYPPNPGLRNDSMAAPRSSLGVVPQNPPILRPTLVLHLLFEVLSTVPGDTGGTFFILFWTLQSYHLQKECDDYKQLSKDFPLPFLGSDLIFFAENLLRNSF